MHEFAAPGGGPDGPAWSGTAFGVVIAALAVIFLVRLVRRRK